MSQAKALLITVVIFLGVSQSGKSALTQIYQNSVPTENNPSNPNYASKNDIYYPSAVSALNNGIVLNLLHHMNSGEIVEIRFSSENSSKTPLSGAPS